VACGQRREARNELQLGGRVVEALEVRDLAVRALLQIDVADFEARFARACDRATRAPLAWASVSGDGRTSARLSVGCACA
jgi:hypothetical protein